MARAGPDGFFWTCLRHHVRPSYGDFLNTFAMKAHTGPYGSYNKTFIFTDYLMTMEKGLISGCHIISLKDKSHQVAILYKNKNNFPNLRNNQHTNANPNVTKVFLAWI